MSERGSDEAPAGADWRERRERGSVAAIRLTVWLTGVFGRRLLRPLVWTMAFYFTLFGGAARRAVHDYRRRLGQKPSFLEVYRQIRAFAQTVLDALFIVRGRWKYFRVTRNGHHHLARLRDEGRGAILLGAHVGSFYAMRLQAEREALPIHPVVYLKNAQRINAAFESIDPAFTERLIQMDDEGGMSYVLKIREELDQGGLIAILGDRVAPGSKTVEVDFLGGRARLPAGPYIVASTLKCPVYFTAGLYREPDRYELYCIPLAERVELPRSRREEALREYAQRYADQLAEMCRRAPDNWFNFYDFWEK